MADVVVVIEDLIFSTKIVGTARSVGLDARVVRTGEALADALEDGGVELVIVDMGLGVRQACAALGRAAAHDPKPTTLAFYPHVEQAWRQAAEDAGADVVMVRSRFSDGLATLLTDACRTRGQDPVD